mmetsp:Transcript_29779/g.81390  ORF Transcript_29779/g.81390 Transcript_29779/m.81390 type:complete len:454 (+) Transcript_29779:122-1483(+)
MQQVLPFLAKCEVEYTWNWPGDVRLAQCLLDAGIKVQWLRTFHSEGPASIIDRSKPMAFSAPISLTLPPVTFHHVDGDWMAKLEKMQVVTFGVNYYDLSSLMLRRLRVSSNSSGAMLDMWIGHRVAYKATESGTFVRFGDQLVDVAVDAGRALGNRASGNGRPTFVQRFVGGECRSVSSSSRKGSRTPGRLLGGHSAIVQLSCGPCDAATSAIDTDEGPEKWATTQDGESSGKDKAVNAGMYLSTCSVAVSRDGCSLSVLVAVREAECPHLQPLRRMGLDVGTRPGIADVALDGLPTRAWSPRCILRSECARVFVRRTKGGGRRERVNGAVSAMVEYDDAVSMTNLTLYAHVLTGSTPIQMSHLAAPAGVKIRLFRSPRAPIALDGGSSAPNATIGDAIAGSRGELSPSPIFSLEHACLRETRDLSSFGGIARAIIRVHRHAPLHLTWRVDCQ